MTLRGRMIAELIGRLRDLRRIDSYQDRLDAANSLEELLQKYDELCAEVLVLRAAQTELLEERAIRFFNEGGGT